MTKRTRPLKPAPSPLDPERAVLALRAARAAKCEADIGRALATHRCALQAVQVMTNGIPGPMTIRVIPLDQPPPDQQAGEQPSHV